MQPYNTNLCNRWRDGKNSSRLYMTEYMLVIGLVSRLQQSSVESISVNSNMARAYISFEQNSLNPCTK